MSAPIDFAGLFKTPAPWLRGTGPHSEMVLSTRIRLARNLADVPFTQRARNEDLMGVLSRVGAAVHSSSVLGGGLLLRMQDCSAIERQVQVERHLVSHALSDGTRPRGIYVAPDDRVSLMINEEDHLRLQTLVPGFQLAEAWGLADVADDELDARLEYAFSE
ncbi:MAG: ATP--guanido phosphotransferase, partial [bacterium]